ncbi:MAG: hypothetical protein ETSY2_00150 [Candidatus Entotheonella gemina]|uniref:Uncharacterized protein n=1 Tax=Candidatus Entotheonella gemina TaxID=1429439 RepID=W4MGA6_9BACT|nr:MAG: hypothetical protein ETSY2_00150 [Candidatus Entotheonella gemina]
MNAASRHNLGTLIRYAHHQGMSQKPLSVDDLFDASVRGEEWRLPFITLMPHR